MGTEGVLKSRWGYKYTCEIGGREGRVVMSGLVSAASSVVSAGSRQVPG